MYGIETGLSAALSRGDRGCRSRAVPRISPARGDRLELPRQRWRHATADANVPLAIFDIDGPPLTHTRKELACGVWQRDVDVDPQRCQHRGDLGTERLHAVARQRRDEDRPADRWRDGRTVHGRAIDEVGLVEYDQAWLVARPELVEDGLDRRSMLIGVRIRGVDHLEQDVGAVDLLARRPERIDELVRQLVDEANGVGHDRGLPITELDLARRRVQRREELVLGSRHFRADEFVEQRRFAGVRITDDAHGGPQAPITAAGGRGAVLTHLVDAVLHLGDARADDAPVGLQLALTGTA